MFNKRKDSKRFSAGSQVELLEQRLLYSADPLGAFVDATAHELIDDITSLSSKQLVINPRFDDNVDDLSPSIIGDTTENASARLHVSDIDIRIREISDQIAVESADTDVTTTGIDAGQRTEIIFVDAGLTDSDWLATELAADDGNVARHVYLLDQSADGIGQIGSVLNGFQSVDAVHIVSHGDDGSIVLGNSVLSTDTLSQYRDEITQWRHAFSSGGDVLIYGCDMASTAEGKALVDILALLTDSDVAASTDTSGHETLNGDWDLEYHSGDVQSQVAIVDYLAKNWTSTLDVVTVDTFDDINDGGDTSSIANLLANPGTDGISLREAIIATNNDAGQADTIVLSAGTYTLAIAGANEEDAATGDLDIKDHLTILGAGASQTIIDGDNTHRIFHVIGDSPVDVFISDLKIQNGLSAGSENRGPGLDIESNTFTPNVTLDGVWLASNNTTSNNFSSGGSIFNNGNLSVHNSLIEGNTADWGGGVTNFFSGTLNMTNVTLANNSATSNNGGGIMNFNTVVLQNVTVSGNSADVDGGGIRNANLGGGTVELHNTLVSGNTASTDNDLSGNYISSGGNLVEIVASASGLHPSDITGINPDLGALADNGGATPTFALNAGSAAIAAGFTGGTPTTDQRGVVRDASPDIGSFEYDAKSSVLLSTQDAVSSPSGAPGLDSWADGEVVAINNPDFTLEPGPTNGTFSSLFNLSNFASDSDANIDGLHYVTRDMTIVGFEFFAGDILFSTDGDETLQGTSFSHRDVLLFHPTVAGDYSTGTFSLVIDQSVVGGEITNDIQGLTLVENDTVVGDITLQTGDFLLLMDGGGHDDDIFRLTPTVLGVGSAGISSGRFIEGGQINFNDNFSGIELIEADTAIGDEAVNAGQLVMTIEKNTGSVGSNDLDIEAQDIFVLNVTATTSGSGTAAATAVLLFEGADLGFDNSQNWNALSFDSVVPNLEPVVTSTVTDPTFTEGGVAVSPFTATAVSTVEAGQSVESLTLTVSNVSDGANELLTLDGSTIALTDGVSGISTTNALTYNVSVAAGTATVTVTGGSLSEAATQNLVDGLRYQNTSEDPTAGSRVVTLTEVVDSGGTANGGDDTTALSIGSTVAVQSVNDEPTLTTTANNPTFTEGNTPVALFGSTSVSTVEAGQMVSGLTLTVSNLNDGASELLTLDGSTIALTDGVSGISATNALTYNVSVAAGTATVTVTGGSLSEAATQTLVSGLRYQNSSQDPTTGNRVVTLTEVVDSGGTATGGDDTTALSIGSTVAVQSVNDEPTLTTTANNPTFTEGNTPVALFGSTSVSTVEAGQMVSGLTLTVSNVSDGANELLTIDDSTIALTDGVSGISTTNALTYNVSVAAGTATVTVTGGSLSEAATQALVSGLRYQNTSEDPTAGNRVVTLTEVVDSGGTANGGDNTTALSIGSTVAVQSVNDEPTLTTTANNPTFTEGNTAVALFGSTSVSTVEAGQTVSSLTLTVSNVSDGANELLTIDGSTIALTDGVSGVSATNALTYNVSVAAGTATVTVTGGSLSEAATQTVIDGLRYQNSSQDPTAGNRVVTLTEVVDSGGTANGGDNTTALSIGSTVAVQSVNDEPTLTTTANNPTFTEGNTAVALFGSTSVSTVEAGQTVSSLTLTVSNVSDGANELLTIDGSTIALTDGVSGISTTNALTYNVSVAAGTATVTVTGGSLSEAATQALVSGLRYQNTSEDPTAGNRVVTLTEVVDSGGTANGGDDTTALTIGSTVAVQSVNDEPTLTTTANNPTFTEGNTPVALFGSTSVSTVEAGQMVSGLTLTVSNVSDGANELLTIDDSTIALTDGVSGISTTNALTYNVSVAAGTATVTVTGGSLSEAATQTLVSGLRYQNSSQDPTTGNRVVTLTEVVDSGGTANGGDNTTALSIGSIVTVQSVNDEPTLTTTANNPTFTEGNTPVALFGSTSVSTVEAGQMVSGLTLTVSNLNDGASELLTLDGSTIALTDGVSGISATNALTYNVSVAAGTATVTVTGGSLSEAATQTLVSGLRYQNSSQDPTTGNRVVTLTEVVDSGGTANGGDDTTTLSIGSTVAVQSVNDEPTLTTTANNPAFTEGNTPVALFGSTSVSTVEAGQTVSGLTLTVSNLNDGASELLTLDGSTIALTDGVSGISTTNALTYNVSVAAGTATVTVTGGSLSEAATQNLVDGLRYQNTSEDPTAGSRVVTLTEVVDSGGTANGGDNTTALSIGSIVTVQSVNDEPTLTTTANNPAFTEGNTPVALFGSTSVSTVEAGQTVSGLTLTVSNLNDGASELLTLDGSTIALTDGVSGISATNALTYNVSVAAGTATVTVTGGSLSEAATQTLVSGLRYQNSSQDPTTGNRVVTLTEVVDSGGTANGGDDTTALSIGSTVAVQSVNDEPTLTTTANNPAFTEGNTPVALFGSTSVSTVEAGQTVSGLTLTVSDVRDGASELLTIDGSTITLIDGVSGNSTNNSLSYNVSVVTDTATVTVTGGSLSEAALQTLVDGLRYQNSSIVPTDGIRVFTLAEVVDSGGILLSGQDRTALDIASSVSVNAVNSEQLIVNNLSETVLEGGSVLISSEKLLTSDIDDSAENLVYRLSSAPEHGFLYVAGSLLVGGDTFSQADIDADLLVFEHDGSETTTDSFEFSVNDGKGSESTGTFSLTIQSVNDNDPVAGDDVVVVDEGGTATEADLSTGQSLFAGDSDADLPDDVLSIATVPVVEPQHGSLTLNSDGSFVYVHDGSETEIDTFSYELSDSDGGQTDIAVVTVIVLPVNDLPVVQQNRLDIGPAETVVLSSDDLAASDVDSPRENLVFNVLDVTGGQFELLSAPGVGIAAFTQTQVDEGLIVFVSGEQDEIPGYSIAVSDGQDSQQASAASINFVPALAAAAPLPVPETASFVDTTPIPQIAEALQEESKIVKTNEDVPAEISSDNPDRTLYIDYSSDREQSSLAVKIFNNLFQRIDRDTVVQQEELSRKSVAAATINDQEILTLFATQLNEFELERLLEGFNDVRDGSERAADLQQTIVGSSAGITAGLTVGYVAWLIRGGVLLSSALSSLPAWNFIDPLPVLSHKSTRDESDSTDDDSLENIVRNQIRALRRRNKAHE